MLHEILKTNGRFSRVVVGYSAHLSHFKDQFKTMEHISSDLARRLESGSNEANEYIWLKNEVSKLTDMVNELKMAKQNKQQVEESLAPSEHTTQKKAEIGQLEAKIADKRIALEHAHAKSSAKSHAIVMLLTPLERPARKYDHEQEGKIHLTDFVANPASKIGAKEAFSTFKTLLEDMRKKISSNELQFKDPEQILSHISLVQKTDIPAMISELHQLEVDEQQLRSEMQLYDAKLQSLLKIERAAETSKMSLEQATRKAERINTEISNTKKAIEEQFFKYYKSKITILL